MKKRIKRFNRSTSTREYRKVFNIFMEGQKTEPLYFEIIKRQCNQVSILLHTSTTKTDPQQVLIRAKRHIKKNNLAKNEEAWIVIDVDNREKDKFNILFSWQDENKRYGVAISNPSFEYWLLLHFESGDNIHGSSSCLARLRQHLKNYRKNNLGINRLENDQLKQAVENAKKKCQSCQDWHTDNHSTVYELVEKILVEENKLNKLE